MTYETRQNWIEGKMVIGAAERGEEVRIKGYKVKVRYQATKEEEKKAKREAVAQVIPQAMKRMRERK